MLTPKSMMATSHMQNANTGTCGGQLTFPGLSFTVASANLSPGQNGYPFWGIAHISPAEAFLCVCVFFPFAGHSLIVSEILDFKKKKKKERNLRFQGPSDDCSLQTASWIPPNQYLSLLHRFSTSA